MKIDSVFPASWVEPECGLTKRELFAAMGMQGLLSQTAMNDRSVETIAEIARCAADALLAELAKEPP